CALLIATVSLAGTISVTKRSPAVDPKFTTPKFTVPAGFTVELVASSRTKTATRNFTITQPMQARRRTSPKRIRLWSKNCAPGSMRVWIDLQNGSETSAQRNGEKELAS
ncbi:MAG: hypothetical protein CMO80_16970, partial [Verrucomicrobiales bacterium]|nr:hypothetical protein [Verrucomicrobiales bacterium]